MAFKLTYSDGQETDYDDNTKWEVEDGVVKMGRDAGKWTVFVSPSHWATLELVSGKDRDEKDKVKHKEDDEDDKDDDKHKDDKAGKGKKKDS
jgi:hypothetical protein